MTATAAPRTSPRYTVIVEGEAPVELPRTSATRAFHAAALDGRTVEVRTPAGNPCNRYEASQGPVEVVDGKLRAIAAPSAPRRSSAVTDEPVAPRTGPSPEAVRTAVAQLQAELSHPVVVAGIERVLAEPLPGEVVAPEHAPAVVAADLAEARAAGFPTVAAYGAFLDREQAVVEGLDAARAAYIAAQRAEAELPAGNDRRLASRRRRAAGRRVLALLG